MNPWMLLGIGAAWLASLGAAAGFAYSAGADHCNAVQAREERTAYIATAAAASAAASAIAGIEIRHTTIRQRAATEIRSEVRYLDCRHPDSVRRLLDAALNNAEPASSADRGQLPPAGAAR